jgi:putative membrane protein insertion efficiency factor
MKDALILLIRLYQKFISPLFPSTCRFHPSCSSYAIMAIEKYGVIKGGLKATWRILRCNPFAKGGIDYP